MDIQFGTYIASISEHNDNEDLHGRLSMWRAFGGNSARVAFVFRPPYASRVAEALAIMFSPVAYLTAAETHEQIASVVANIGAEAEFLKSTDRQTIFRFVVSMFVAGVVCLKHEGFREEQEWRLIYSPNRWASPHVKVETRVVGGVPQTIYKLPFDASVSPDIAELDLPRIFDRLIIGPTPYPWVMYQAFVMALKDAGVADAETRVFCSGIPIRA